MIDLNTATAAQLTTLPGIGPKKAEAIVQYRTEKGRFMAIEELKAVKGIGEKTFESIKSMIMVSPAEEVVAPAEPTKAE
jgi:competence protein ComEA